MDKTLVYNFLLEDMEINDKIFPLIDNTITTFGSTELKTSLRYITTNSAEDLAMIVKYIHDNDKYRGTLEKLLRLIRKHNDIVQKWIFFPRDHDMEFFMGLTYKVKIGDTQYDLFNNPVTLTISNMFRFSTVVFQIIFYIVMYRMMKYLGNDMTVREYLWSLVVGYYTSATFFLSFFTSNNTAVDYLAKGLATLNVCYTLYSIYKSVVDCMDHYSKCEEFKRDYGKISRVINACNEIFIHDEFKNILYTKTELTNITNSFKKLRTHFNNNHILGEMIVETINFAEFKKELSTVLAYAGKTDALISNSKLLDMGYSTPLADIDSVKPYINVVNLFNPLLDYDKQTNNDVTLGLNEHKTMIITGPNKAGKSTFMRSLILSIYLAQSLGVTCAESLQYTPFVKIFTYLNVPDSIGKESLFEAELERCYEYYNTVKSTEGSNNKIIGFMDELFTGTNYLEGMSGSYAIIKKISENPNSMTIVTTHFHEICNIPNITYTKFYANEKDKSKLKQGESQYDFTYKIKKGISDQCIALNLLQERGYGADVINLAVDKLNEVKKVDK